MLGDVRQQLAKRQSLMRFTLTRIIVANTGSDERRGAEALVQQALEAVARASKGFSLHLCTVSRPRLADLLEGPLHAAIHIPQARASARTLQLTPGHSTLLCLLCCLVPQSYLYESCVTMLQRS
jgi:hypothetical protein